MLSTILFSIMVTLDSGSTIFLTTMNNNWAPKHCSNPVILQAQNVLMCMCVYLSPFFTWRLCLRDAKRKPVSGNMIG